MLFIHKTWYVSGSFVSLQVLVRTSIHGEGPRVNKGKKALPGKANLTCQSFAPSPLLLAIRLSWSGQYKSEMSGSWVLVNGSQV